MQVNTQTIGSLGTDSLGTIPGLNSGITGARNGIDHAYSDVVRLSNASALVSVAKTMAGSSQSSKVAALANQVRSGSYQVSGGEISHALIGDLLT